jgi:hypothetical protein
MSDQPEPFYEGIAIDRSGRVTVVTPEGWADFPTLCASGELSWDCEERVPAAYRLAAKLIMTEKEKHRERERQRELCGEPNEWGERYDWHL